MKKTSAQASWFLLSSHAWTLTFAIPCLIFPVFFFFFFFFNSMSNLSFMHVTWFTSVGISIELVELRKNSILKGFVWGAPVHMYSFACKEKKKV